MLVLEIVLRLPQEQVNTTSDKNKIELVFRVLVEKLHQQGGKTTTSQYRTKLCTSR